MPKYATFFIAYLGREGPGLYTICDVVCLTKYTVCKIIDLLIRLLLRTLELLQVAKCVMQLNVSYVDSHMQVRVHQHKEYLIYFCLHENLNRKY